MIKEVKKSTKYNFTKTKRQVVKEYARTILCSILVSLIITSILAISARNEMIRDLYNNVEEQRQIDKKIAQEVIAKTNFLSDLKEQKYAVCMHIGDIYETAGDYHSAQIAYEMALSKAPANTYKPYYKLIYVLVTQEKFKEANEILNSIHDYSDKDLIKFKTRSYLTLGDKYYSIGKFLSSAKCYEKADFYYSKFSKKDAVIETSIKNRIINAYIQVADLMVKNNMNTEAVRFLKKAETFSPNNFKIDYKLAIVLSETDPEESVKYFDLLLEKIPQDIDYNVYTTALMKAANIADLDNRPTQAKYYRYKIYSMDLFVNRKLIYKNDIETFIKSIKVQKVLFTYPLKVTYGFLNLANTDIINAKGDFVLCVNDKPVETITKDVANKDKPLLAFVTTPNDISINFKKNIFTKKELENYTVKIYLYKDAKYKTLIYEHKIPKRSWN